MSEVFCSINPYTQTKLSEFVRHSSAQVDACLGEMESSFSSWRLSSLSERQELLMSLHDSLLSKKNLFAELISLEMGKPIAQSLAEIEKSASVCRFYAERAEEILQPRRPMKEAQVLLRPLGILLMVMPWNFPFWQVFRVLAPNLLLGNILALKHASNVPGCAQAVENLFSELNVGSKLFANFFLDANEVEKLIADPRVAAVTLTGSTEAGRHVAMAAARNLKKSVLELGGSDPYVILEDADLDQAAKICAQSRLINTGQSCIAAKRFIVQRNVHDDFVEKFREELFSFEQGNPLEMKSNLGPLARIELSSELESQVNQSLQAGAQCYVNERTKREGALYPTTLLTNVRKGMRVYDEEVFGPVAAVIEAESEEEAIKFANDSSFGLGSAIFTQNREKAIRLAENEIEAGMVFINDFVRSDPRLEFGGIKHSGYGRELGLMGLFEFANVKSIVSGA
ncbi:MAG: aldehyde dehydrogenase family protein [Bdellovibrionota bacterium]